MFRDRDRNFDHLISVIFGKVSDLGDTFSISEIRFRYSEPISRDNETIV